MTKMKETKYIEEYRMSKSKVEYIEIMMRHHPHLTQNSITRRWYDCKKAEMGLHFKYRKEYEDTETRDAFIGLMKERYIKLKESSIKRYYREMRRYLGKQIAKQTRYFQYDDKNKERPSHMKMLLIKDMKQHGKKTTKGYLHRYGFNPMETNWLEDEGYINDE